MAGAGVGRQWLLEVEEDGGCGGCNRVRLERLKMG